MPFISKSQLRTCFNSSDKSWDCKKMLKETPSVFSLPERTGGPHKKYKKRTRRSVSAVRTGARGGNYIEITESFGKDDTQTMKVYISNSAAREKFESKAATRSRSKTPKSRATSKTPKPKSTMCSSKTKAGTKCSNRASKNGKCGHHC